MRGVRRRLLVTSLSLLRLAGCHRPPATVPVPVAVPAPSPSPTPAAEVVWTPELALRPVSPEATPDFLDAAMGADREALRTAVGESLAWLAAQPEDRLLSF